MKIITRHIPVVLLLLAILSCCTSKEKSTNEDELGHTHFTRHLYLGDNGVLHKSESCMSLKYGKDDRGHRIYGKKYIDTLDIISDKYMSYCTRCIDSDDYDRIQKMIKRNSTMPGVEY